MRNKRRGRMTVGRPGCTDLDVACGLEAAVMMRPQVPVVSVVHATCLRCEGRRRSDEVDQISGVSQSGADAWIWRCRV